MMWSQQNSLLIFNSKTNYMIVKSLKRAIGEVEIGLKDMDG